MRRLAGGCAVVTLAALVLCGIASAAWYLKLDGVQGESTSSSPDKLLFSYHLGVRASADAFPENVATVQRTRDTLTPTLIKAVATGEHYPLVEVAAGTRTICLGDASVASVKDSGGGESPSESVAFNFGTIHVAYGSGGCSRGKTPAAVAFTGEAGSNLEARVDCLAPACTGTLSVDGSAKIPFTVRGGYARAVDVPVRDVKPGRSHVSVIVLEHGGAQVVSHSDFTVASPWTGHSMTLTCVVFGTQNVSNSITGLSWPGAAGQTVSITWTAPSGKSSVHTATVKADGTFDDTLTPDEAGTWTGEARLGTVSAHCSIPITPTSG